MLSAVYLVPVEQDSDSARSLIDSALPSRAPDPLGAVAADMLSRGAAQVAVMPALADPPVPEDLQKTLGVPPELLEAVTSATRFAVVRAMWLPSWPPLHELVARACAGVLAAEVAAPLVDTSIPQVLSAERALATLQPPPVLLTLSQWVLVFISAGPRGLWLTTKGLSRFGLPELRVENVPPQLGEHWNVIMNGIAAKVFALWFQALRKKDSGASGSSVASGLHEGPGSSGASEASGSSKASGSPEASGPGDSGVAFVQIPDLIVVSEADVARAHNTAPKGGRYAQTLFRLAFDPASDPGEDSFLTVQPPDDFPGSAGEYFAQACTAIFGPAEQDVRYLPPTQAMDDAIAAARAALPAARSRFLAGDIPSRARLMVKHRIALPAAPDGGGPSSDGLHGGNGGNGGGTEYPWAYVNSWDDPATVLASAAADAELDPGIRAGRPIVIAADAIVDWAIWVDGEGVVEGGLTNRVAMAYSGRDDVASR
jgi:hypothetical protein